MAKTGTTDNNVDKLRQTATSTATLTYLWRMCRGAKEEEQNFFVFIYFWLHIKYTSKLFWLILFVFFINFWVNVRQPAEQFCCCCWFFFLLLECDWMEKEFSNLIHFNFTHSFDLTRWTSFSFLLLFYFFFLKLGCWLKAESWGIFFLWRNFPRYLTFRMNNLNRIWLRYRYAMSVVDNCLFINDLFMWNF